MTRTFWKRKLQFFLEPEPTLHPAGEDVYIPREKLKVAFWFEGGLKVSGGPRDLQVNFNDPQILTLSLQTKRTNRIFRVPYSRIVCFELVHSEEDDNTEFSRRLFLN
jgi:hypothetical protein